MTSYNSSVDGFWKDDYVSSEDNYARRSYGMVPQPEETPSPSSSPINSSYRLMFTTLDDETPYFNQITVSPMSRFVTKTSNYCYLESGVLTQYALVIKRSAHTIQCI
jgi:hypothetical protein